MADETRVTLAQIALGKTAGGVPMHILVDEDGTVHTTGAGGSGGLTDTELRASPVPVTQTGSATSAKQDTGNTSLASIDTKAPSLVSGRVPVDPSGVTSPVSAASLPLPTGAATSASQTTGNNSLSSIDVKLPALVSSRVPVDPSGVTSPVSAASLPLPTGAATAAKQPALGTAGTPSTDVITVQGSGSGTALPVSAASLPLPTGAATAAKQPALGTAGTPSADVITTQGNGYNPKITVTRPANTTAYTAGDVVGDVGGSAIIQFTSAGPSGGYVMIAGASLRIHLSAVPSGMTSFRLHLYDASPDAIADNAVYAFSSAGDRGKYLGYIDFGTPVVIGSTLYVKTPNINEMYKLAAASTTLYGQLVTAAGYTPTSVEVYVVELKGIAA